VLRETPKILAATDTLPFAVLKACAMVSMATFSKTNEGVGDGVATEHGADHALACGSV
jgi:hypothetical protein